MTGLYMSGTFMGLNAIILIIGRFYFPSLYIQETEVIEIASTLLLIAALFQLSDGIQVVGLGALRGMTDVRIPTLITLIAYWGVALPIGYLLGFSLRLGASGIWIGLLAGLTLAAVLLFIRFNRLSKMKLTLDHKM
jgi:MATE family multidrug resistance protein